MKTQLPLTTLALAAGASAQTNATFILMASNDVTPASPSTTISVYAAWDQLNPGDLVFGAADYDLVATEGLFSSPTLVLGMNPPNNPGTANGSRVDGAAIGQVHLPSIGIFASEDNPILLAEYTWTTTNFAFRSVDFVTENTASFLLVPGVGGTSVNMVSTGQFTPGVGSLTVVPAPATLASLAGMALAPAVMRRRRPGASR